jgi:K+-dependent Na+/Ca+ exchanger-like protein
MALMAIAGIFYVQSEEVGFLGEGRRLRSTLCQAEDDGDDGDDDSACPEKAHPPGLCVLYALGALYLFVALAVVCDEFFVPPLEEIAERWDISDDVAGATLMAAGGSAPELATSLIGTFQGSDVGFGTIVGSAVFNVLFVIACCVIFTPTEFAPLQLTGWPLARDCLYYSFTLVMVAIMFGINTPGIIEGWEAAFLFLLYLGYCTIMAYNGDLYERFHTNKPIHAGEGDDEVPEEEHKVERRGSVNFPSHYRTGFVQMLTQDRSMFDTAAVHCVRIINGDVKSVFEKLDVDKSGTLEATEIKQMLIDLYSGNKEAVTEDHVAEVMKELDIDKNGVIDYAEFTVWYVQSEERLRNEERSKFDEIDMEKKGINVRHLGPLLHKLHIDYAPSQLDEAISYFGGPESTKLINYEEFSKWFEGSSFWEDRKHDAEIAAESAEGIWGELLDFPKETFSANAIYIFLAPITWSLGLTAGIRDVRVPGNGNWAFFQFFVSIGWIGFYSYFCVDWIETIGATIGVPSVVMGLTILAAGTSIPDLLSSIVVAKAGKGDMAVSSSIGSNIFDVTVGLPVPWILFNIIMDCPVIVGADNLFISVFVLLGMVVTVVLSIMLSNWKMSKGLGITMLILYVLFVAQDVIRVYTTEDIKC